MLNENMRGRGERREREKEMKRWREENKHAHDKLQHEHTCNTYSEPVRLKSIPPMVKEIVGKELILEQSKVYCMKNKIYIQHHKQCNVNTAEKTLEEVNSTRISGQEVERGRREMRKE